MSKAPSVTSAEGNDGVLELEYSKLQRAFRLMESERKAYSDEARLIIKKQRYALEKMRKDNDYLIKELALLQHRSEDSKRNGLHCEKAEMYQQQTAFYQARMRTAADMITALDKELDLVHQRMNAQRQTMGGVNASIVNNQAIEKQIRVLENRLDQSLVKYNRALATNQRFRSMIDNLRRERLVFDSVYTKFEKELADQKKAMAEIIESSNSAYEARDEAQAKILLLSEKAEKEFQAYSQEVKELDRTLEQDRKLKNFLVTKAADRLAETSGSNNTPAKLRPRESRNALGSSQDVLTASMSSYEKVLNHIQEVTGVRSLDELVQRFKDVEDHNFSLFNYVNQVNNEVEKVAEEIVCVQRHMSNIAQENKQAEIERTKKLAILEHELKETQKETEAMSQRNEEIHKVMQKLYVGVQQLVESFQASNVAVTSTMPVPTDENGDSNTSNNINGNTTNPSNPTSPNPSTPATNGLSGTTTTPTPSTPAPTTPMASATIPPVTVNPLLIPPIVQPAGSSIADALIMHLGIIEQKANDLLILYQLTMNPRKLASAGGAPASVPNSAAPNMDDREGTVSTHRGGPTQVVVTIQAPNTGDNDSTDEENEDEGPLSRDELVTKCIRGINKRIQNGGSSKKRRGRRLNDKKGNE